MGWDASLALVTEKLRVADFATGIGIVAFVAGVVAYTLAPMINAMRRLLAGDLLPDWVRSVLIEANKGWAGKLEAEIGEIAAYGVSVKKRLDTALADLQAPKSEGEQPSPAVALGNLTATTTPPDPAIITAALVALEARLRDAGAASERKRWQPEAGAAVLVAIGAAHDALSAFKKALAGSHDGRFDTMLIRFQSALDGALAVASRLQSDRRTALQLAYVASDPQPTRFGNLTAACEHYPMAAYGVGYEFIWPHVQLAIGPSALTLHLLHRKPQA